MAEDKTSQITYAERPVTLTADGLICGCGAVMQFFTNHVSERGGQILSKVYVCPKCNNEAAIKLQGKML